jgi:hypothetical protein
MVVMNKEKFQTLASGRRRAVPAEGHSRVGAAQDHPLPSRKAGAAIAAHRGQRMPTDRIVDSRVPSGDAVVNCDGTSFTYAAELTAGPYVSPIAVPGVNVTCELRGMVKIVGLSSGPILWPIGLKDGERRLIIYKGLATALRNETAQAVARNWNIPLGTAKAWQQQLAAVDEQNRPPAKKPKPPKRKKLRKPNRNVRRWSREEDDLVRLRPAQEVADLLDVSHTLVNRRRKVLAVGLHEQLKDSKKQQ